jgi:hypothetical protein
LLARQLAAVNFLRFLRGSRRTRVSGIALQFSRMAMGGGDCANRRTLSYCLNVFNLLYKEIRTRCARKDQGNAWIRCLQN